MCGILCRIGTRSECVPDFFQGHLTNDGITTWECKEESIIKTQLIDKDLKSTLELTSSDKRKIENLGEIRKLTTKLNQVKNSIGKSDTHAKELAEERGRIETMIQNLNLEGEGDEEKGAIVEETNDLCSEFKSLVLVIATRGPDYVKYTKSLILPGIDTEQFSSVLSLRQPLCSQPIEIEVEKFSLQFNGELYNKECLDSNDTEFIAERLMSNVLSYEDRELAVVTTLGELYGEFAYVLIDRESKKCYYGRDFVGKRSLVYSQVCSDLVISSVTLANPNFKYFECEAELIYKFDIESKMIETISLKLKSKDSYREYQPINTSLLGLSQKEEEINKRIHGFQDIFFEACKVRIETIHPLHGDPTSTHLGILFSGGLDCTVIAGTIGQLLQNPKGDAHKYYIDLLTVGFDNPRTQVPATDSPDRVLAKKSWSELASKFNNEKLLEFRLVEVNVPYEEWLRHRERVKRLMFPCDTEMDLSIAIAFYFASRGNGDLLRLRDGEIATELDYVSNAKVLLSGLGADELFAGYLRHERILNDAGPGLEEDESNNAWLELAEELTTDIKRIYVRNLGRDDRCISLWGKELRYPFLDERVINYALQEIELDLKLSVLWEEVTNKKGKTSIRMKPIRKWILREFAELLDLGWVKHELKRAIQFGAKSAKMEVGQSKTRGTDQL